MVRLAEARRLIGEAEREDRARMGRLDEGEQALLAAVARGRYARIGPAQLRLPVYRSTRAGRRRADGRVEVPIHISVSFIAKRGASCGAALTTHEAAARQGRIYLHPGRGELTRLRAAGAHRDRKLGGWWIGEAQFRAQPELHRFATPSADAARFSRRTGRGKARRGAAAAFQLYVEAAAADERGRMARLVHDEEGAISIGTLGDTPGERAAFWAAVVERERADGRVQNRAIVELPHELLPAEIRRLVEELVRPLAERGLPYHAAVHRPDVEEGSDPRNVHLHILWSERPTARTGPFEWRFAKKKDRGAQGPAWVRAFRRCTVEAVNGALDRAEALRGVRILRRYHPGTYKDMGVEKLPGLHLGPRSTALERAGVPTAAAITNELRERVWTRLTAAERTLARSRRVLEVVLRPGVPAAVAERLAALEEQLTVEPSPPAPPERAAVRLAWAEGVLETPGVGEKSEMKAHLAAETIVTARPLITAPAAAPPDLTGEIRLVVFEAVRAAVGAAPWSRQCDQERALDRVAVAAGRLDPPEAVRRECLRRDAAAGHAAQALAAVEAAAPGAGTADPAWARRRARAAAEAEAWSAWSRAADALAATLGGLPAPEARSAALRVLTDGGPPARARQRNRGMER